MNAPSAPELFKALKGKGRAGDFMCACPAHRDRTPSLHVTEKQGAVLLKCHAGCPQEAVIDALRERHLWPEKSNGSSGYHHTSSRPPEQIEVVPPEDMSKPPILPEPTMGEGVEFKRREALASADVAHEFVYRQGGEPVFIKQRRKTGPKFLPFYRIADAGGELWQNKKPEGFKRLPYVAHGAPDPFQNAEKRLLWCEGERDVDSVAKLGFDAFTFGAAKDIPVGAEPYVRGRHVVIPADNDEAGMADAEAKVRYCRGHAASVTIVTFPELPKGGDVSDWITAGHARDELRQRIIETPEPKEEPEAPRQTAGEETEAFKIHDAGDDVDLPPPRGWLLGNTFCRQFISSELAEGGTGKTSRRYACYLSLVTNRPLVGEHVFQRGRVLIVSLEDNTDEARRRILAARIHHNVTLEDVKGWLFYVCPGAKDGKLMAVDRGGHAVVGALAGSIEAAIVKHKIDLVALDPFIKTHSVPENDNSLIDDVVQVLSDLAAKYDIAIDAPHHVSKGAADPGNANRGRGASAMKDGGRLVTTLTVMAVEEAKLFGVAEEDRKQYIRVDNAKVNIIRGGGKPGWFKLVGVPLNNGNALYPNGDEVQTVEVWKPPELWADISVAELNQILDKIDAGLPDGSRHSAAPNAKGRAAWQAVTELAPTKSEDQAREIIKQWIRNGVLVNEDYDNPVTRKVAKGLRVDHTKRPTP